jgi:hypothetical protein
MASSRDVKVLKAALQLAIIDMHQRQGDCPDPSTCCDVEFMREAYMRRGEEAVDLNLGV